MSIRKVVQCDNCKKQHDIPDFEPFMHTIPEKWLVVIEGEGPMRTGKDNAKHYCGKKCLLTNEGILLAKESKEPLQELIKELGDKTNE